MSSMPRPVQYQKTPCWMAGFATQILLSSARTFADLCQSVDSSHGLIGSAFCFIAASLQILVLAVSVDLALRTVKMWMIAFLDVDHQLLQLQQQS